MPNPDNYVLPATHDNTSLETYTTCPRKYEYTILRGLKSNLSARSLQFGGAFHAGLAEWYTVSGWELERIIERIQKRLDQRTASFPDSEFPTLDLAKLDIFAARTEVMVLAGLADLPALDDAHAGDRRSDALLEAILRGYARAYKYEPFKVIHVEKNFVFALPDGSLYSGIIDLVVEWLEKTIAMEHKTTSTSLTYFGDELNPKHQLDGYIEGLLQTVRGASHVICVNAAFVPRRKEIKVDPDKDFRRFPEEKRTDEQLSEFKLNAVAIIDDIKKDLKRGYFVKNTNSCHQYGGCQFRGPCGADNPGETALRLAAHYHEEFWNPMKRDGSKDQL
jgi:hypothetical protein